MWSLRGCAYPDLVPVLQDPDLSHYGGLVDSWARQPQADEGEYQAEEAEYIITR